MSFYSLNSMSDPFHDLKLTYDPAVDRVRIDPRRTGRLSAAKSELMKLNESLAEACANLSSYQSDANIDRVDEAAADFIKAVKHYDKASAGARKTSEIREAMESNAYKAACKIKSDKAERRRREENCN